MSSSDIYFVQLSNVADITAALNNMLNVDNVNQKTSIMKKGIDAWYERYMTSYTNKLEDTIFCNNRSIKKLNDWNPNGGSVTSYLEFKNYSLNSDLSCTNQTDKFSVSNSKAQLTYPVGLITYPETNLLNNLNMRKTGESYLLFLPRFSSGSASMHFVNETGNYGIGNADIPEGVRPVISLKPGTEYASGTGSMADPYIVE